MLDPIVRYGTDDIVIVLPAAPGGDCGQPEGDEQLVRVTITLDEPVGDRALRDGETLPMRDAHDATDPIVWCCG